MQLSLCICGSFCFQADRFVRLFEPGGGFLFHICHFNVNAVDVFLDLERPALELHQFTLLRNLVLSFLVTLRFVCIDLGLYAGKRPGEYIRINLLRFFLRHDHVAGLQIWQSIQLQLGHRAVIDTFQLGEDITTDHLKFVHRFPVQQEISGDKIWIAQIRPDRHANVLLIRLDIKTGDLVRGVFLAPDASVFRFGIRCAGQPCHVL